MKFLTCHKNVLKLKKKCGVLAQLGERYNGIVEVRGSTPLGSTKRFIMNSAAQSFNTCSEIYEYSRPNYPDAVANFLKSKLGFNTSSQLLELAAGTGKFTDLLVHNLYPTVTEWLQGMLGILRAKHQQLLSIISRAENIPFQNNLFDGVLVAQAFHWFADHITLNDIARVLKNNGYITIIFQERDNQSSWVYDYHKIIYSYPHDDIVKFERGKWKSVFKQQSIFSALEHQKFSYRQPFFKKDLVQKALGMSFIAALPDAQKKNVIKRIQHLCKTHPEIKNHEIIGFPYITHVYWAKVLK